MKHFLSTAAMFAAVLSVSSASAGIGAQYGSRDPHHCRAYKGPMTTAFAEAVFACDAEHVRGLDVLVLVARVSIQLGTPRRFDITRDSYIDVSTTAQVYPIKGGYSEYDCSALAGGSYSRGANCLHVDYMNAGGECYMTNATGWHCEMVGGTQTKYENGVAPPTGN